MAGTASTVLKPLSTTEMHSRAAAFSAKWRNETREHAESQTWWNEFFAIFGVDRYSTAVFERWAKRASTGRQGRIDVFMPGVMIAEHKSLGKDGGKAESQAEDYLAGGDIPAPEMPRYIVSTDFAEVQITDLASPADPPFRFPIAKLTKHIARFAFLSGYHAPVRPIAEQATVSVKAARQMGKLYDALLGDVDAAVESHEGEQAAIFMTRLLFLLYGDDAVGLWEPDAFRHFLENATAEDGSDTGAQIALLFQTLDKPLNARSPRLDDHLKVFPYVNGGLFKTRVEIPTFDRSMREALLAACAFEWSEVTPAVFGSLFQGMSSREKRREQGEHYTSETDILKTLRPLFLDEIEAKLQTAWPSIVALDALHESLADMRYLDAAAGSGNFLIVAYREMRDIELRLLVRLRELRRLATPTKKLDRMGDYALDGTDELKVTPDQFGGIEISWWPAKIAETAMFLADHQANLKMSDSLGSAPQRLPITVAANIVHADALTTDWSTVIEPTDSTIVFGNPPFLGKTQRSGEQTETMQGVWGKEYSGEMDFVTAWFVVAARYLRGTSGRFAFVSTNSIAQGVSVPPLFGMLQAEGWKLRFAHRTFQWKSEATGKASVHCVITGFDRSGATPRLFDYESIKSSAHEISDVKSINGYLVDAPLALIKERQTAISPQLRSAIHFGSMAADGGALFVKPEVLAEFRADPIAAKYLRRFVGAKELINDIERWCIWMPTPNAADIAKSPLLRERFTAVERFRSDPTRDGGVASDAGSPYRFHRIQQPLTNYLGIPRHFAEDRKFATVAFIDASVISGDANFVVDDPDGFLFAVISSHMFMTWQKTVGGRLKSDPRFSSTVSWNNYPFPDLSQDQRAKLIAAGAGVLAARAGHPGDSLAQLYLGLGMPDDLRHAHDVLDRVTDGLFGFRTSPTLIQRQRRLFEKYAEMTTGSELSIEAPSKRRRKKPAEATPLPAE